MTSIIQIVNPFSFNKNCKSFHSVNTAINITYYTEKNSLPQNKIYLFQMYAFSSEVEKVGTHKIFS